MTTLTTTGARKLKINKLTKTQLSNASTLSNKELYLVDPEFAGGKLLATDANGDIVETNQTIPTVDQTYDSTSANAQSGVAINGAGFLKNNATGTGLAIRGVTDSGVAIGDSSTSASAVSGYNNNSIAIGSNARASGWSVSVGYNSSTTYGGVAFGADTEASGDMYYGGVALGYNSKATGSRAIAIGSSCRATASGAIQLGWFGSTGYATPTNSEANTFCVGLGSTNYKLLENDGTIPVGRYKSMTGADGVNAGTAGVVPAPTATDNVKFLKGDGTWAPALVNIATGTYALQIDNLNSTGVGNYGLTTYGYRINAIGSNSALFGSSISSKIGNSSASGVTCVGNNCNISASGVTHIGALGTNSTTGTFSVSVSTNGQAATAHTYTMMDYDGYIPAGRLVNAIQGAITSTTVTLAAASWSSNTQTVNVTGMTASSIVWVSPAGASMSDYASAGVYCSGQASGTLTFTCTSAPSSDLTVQVVFG